jgi:hypothetical protein
MALIDTDDSFSGDVIERRQRLERDIVCLQSKLASLSETFNQSLIPMTQKYQEILQQRLSSLHELS